MSALEMKSQTQTLELPVNLTGSQMDNFSTDTPSISLYEQSREDRIKENLKRMQSLGIMDLSLKLKSTTPDRRKRKYTHRETHQDFTPVLSSGPTRRSSRLQNVTPISYTEVKNDVSLKDEGFKLEPGAKPEVYTEEHEKLLGSTEKSWTFFVDGYGKDGKRIYDPLKGKTCHQCRQKTLGYRTQCCECNMVQGQFCGDCLYMRYGEHVLEALENPNWICPPCRGICNCSLCRTGKGWLPTGAIYRKISKLGFKSVAHYLIQTRRPEENKEKEPPGTANPASAKRSLSFPPTEELHSVTDELIGEMKPQPEDNNGNDIKSEKETKNQDDPNLNTNNAMSARRSLPFSDSKPQIEIKEGLEVPDCATVSSDTQTMDKGCDGTRSEEEHQNQDIASKSCPKPKRKRTTEPNHESIAGRLRQRRRKGDDLNDEKV